MAQFLRPDSNITQTSFTGGFADIDEASASDADWAWGANNTAAVLEVALSNPGGSPGAGTTTFRYRIGKTNAGTLDGGGNAVTVTAVFVQGTTVLATDAVRTATGAWTTYTWTPSTAGVTDWNDLRLRFTTSASGGSPAVRRGGAVTWAELEVPDAAAAQELTPGLVTNSQGFPPPTLTSVFGLLPGLLSEGQAFFAPDVAQPSSPQTLVPSMITNGQTFFAPLTAPSPVTLAPAIVENGQTFHAPAVSVGVVILIPALLDGGNSFFAPVVSDAGGGPSELAPGLVANSPTFFAPAIETSYAIAAPLVVNGTSFHSPSVTPGSIVLSASTIGNSATFYSPDVTASYDIFPSLIDQGQSFQPATIGVGAVTLAPMLVANDNQFFAPTVGAASPQELLASMFTNVIAFPAPCIKRALYQIAGQAVAHYPIQGVAAIRYPLEGVG